MSKSIASRKRASKKTQDRKINFLPEEKVHVGLDVHKRTYTVTLWNTQGKCEFLVHTQGGAALDPGLLNVIPSG